MCVEVAKVLIKMRAVSERIQLFQLICELLHLLLEFGAVLSLHLLFQCFCQLIQEDELLTHILIKPLQLLTILLQ